MPASRETVLESTPLSDEDRAALGLRKRDTALRVAKISARLAATATHRITTRTLWWGAWGGVVGLGAAVGLAASGLLGLPLAPSGWVSAQPWWIAAAGAGSCRSSPPCSTG